MDSPVQVKLHTTRISVPFRDQHYTRIEGEVDATLVSNSTSPSYQLYRASYLDRNPYFNSWWFDGVATVAGEDIVDPDWSNMDFAAAPFMFGCSTD
jgi:hypothetical protein